MDQLAVFFGGRVAELEVFDEMNTGASSDLERASSIARRMVCEWGMSEKLGPVQYASREGEVFLGKEVGRAKEYSEETQLAIDREVRNILDSQYSVAQKIVRDNIDVLHALAGAVLERETLNAEEIEKIINGEDLNSGPEGGGPGGGPGNDADGEKSEEKGSDKKVSVAA